jgi:excisionase family DNA binding protein
MAHVSTQQVARQLGISRVTLERWLAKGDLKPPQMISFGMSKFRNWTASDIERVRKYKRKNYRKGRGRKAKSKR